MNKTNLYKHHSQAMFVFLYVCMFTPKTLNILLLKRTFVTCSIPMVFIKGKGIL